jgi:seryl-tRNA synthetase
VNAASAFATGQLPDKEGQMYHATEDDFYLIPTAEVPVTNVFRDTILKETDLPVMMTAYSPCFRREAGSFGKEVRGLNRVHQFEKVEIIQIVHPDKSETVLDEMVAHVEKLLMSLGLPYRILRLCGGDMGFASAITYDFEVYSAAQWENSFHTFFERKLISFAKNFCSYCRKLSNCEWHCLTRSIEALFRRTGFNLSLILKVT